LIVDDIAVNIKVAAGLLAQYQVEVDTCESGTMAVQLISKNYYDIVFLDHMMPEMDGIETTAIIRKLPVEYANDLVVIALTANAMFGAKDFFLNNGFNDFLSKPIEISKLNALMEKWIPKEKQEIKKIRDGVVFVEESDIAIPGVDVQKGLSMTGGTNKGYKEVLKLFCRSIKERNSIINSMPDKNSLNLFITTIHALKGAAASIGADSLSETAQWLENAARHGNFDAIRERLREFRTDLNEMLTNIENALSEKKEENTTESTGIAPNRELLLSLKESLENEQIGQVDQILEDIAILPLTAEYRNILSDISDLVLIFEYKKAIKLLDELLHKL
jgi:CheY-like chemotaxis protein